MTGCLISAMARMQVFCVPLAESFALPLWRDGEGLHSQLAATFLEIKPPPRCT
jgi:hypothetical protein